MKTFDKLWSGDTRSIRVRIDDAQNGISTGDYNLASAASFVLAIGDPLDGKTYVSRTYLKNEVIDGQPELGEVVLTITGDDSKKVPPGYRTIQIWLVDTLGREYTIYEATYEHRARLSAV